jgi:hypothetical protein
VAGVGTPDDQPRSGGSEATPWQTKLRRGLALLAVLVAVGGFFGARAYDEFESCQTNVTRTSGSPEKVQRETNCKPLPAETLVPVLVLVLALMWPDLTSVELFGLGRVSRRLTEQDARQNQLEAAQQRLENRIENTVAVQQNPTFNFGTNPAAALIAEHKVEEDERRRAAGEAGADGAASSAESYARLKAAVEPLKPWLNIARRLSDPMFAEAVAGGATSGSPADDPRLLPSDVELLRHVQRPGQPFDLDGLRRWASENSLQIDAIRDTMRAGPAANPESVRVATKFAGQLLSDLQRRGLVATE